MTFLSHINEISMRTILTLNHASARRAIDAIYTEVDKRGRAASISVADACGEPIVLLRMDGAKPPTHYIATNQAATAAWEQKRTMELGEWLRNRNIDVSFFGGRRFCGFGGGVPVIFENQSIGAVAFCGLTRLEDEEMANLGVTAALSTAEGPGATQSKV